jgi:aldehyde dehydrogenase (NAD+)
MRIAQEEIFGPTTALIPVKDTDEAIRVANGVRFGLSSSIFTRDVNTAFRAMRDLVTGITYVNAGTIGAEVHLPFGGMKETGNGHREAGQAALDVFTSGSRSPILGAEGRDFVASGARYSRATPVQFDLV